MEFYESGAAISESSCRARDANKVRVTPVLIATTHAPFDPAIPCLRYTHLMHVGEQHIRYGRRMQSVESRSINDMNMYSRAS